MENINKKIALFPFRIIMIFLIFTEILFFIGPIDYQISNCLETIVYLIIVNVSLWLGYNIGIKHFKPSTFQLPRNWIKIILCIGLILTFYDLILTWSSHGISISSIDTMVDSLLTSLSSPGDAYYGKGIEQVQTSLVLLFLSPIEFAAIPIGLFCWNRLNKTYKILTLLIVLVNIILWMGVGIRKGIFDTILIILVVLYVNNTRIIIDKKIKKRILLIVTGIIFLFLSYFIYSNLSRLGYNNVNEIIQLDSGNYKSFYLKYCPLVIVIIMASISSYLSQGYYTLSKAISLGILPIAPLGMSWMTISIGKKIGYDPTKNTYMYILQSKYDIGMTNNWHTIYVWLANDFTFIGVPIIIFFIGFFLAQTWLDSINHKNDLSIPILVLFVIMAFYFYANNQVLSFSFIPFIFWFLIYSISRFNIN